MENNVNFLINNTNSVGSNGSIASASVRELNFLINDRIINNNQDYYTGATELTPSDNEQILPTSGKTIRTNLVVKPIPSNYGKITYSGYELTVS